MKTDLGFSFNFISDYSNPSAGWALYIILSVFTLLTSIALMLSGSPNRFGYVLFK